MATLMVFFFFCPPPLLLSGYQMFSTKWNLLWGVFSSVVHAAQLNSAPSPHPHPHPRCSHVNQQVLTHSGLARPLREPSASSFGVGGWRGEGGGVIMAGRRPLRMNIQAHEKRKSSVRSNKSLSVCALWRSRDLSTRVCMRDVCMRVCVCVYFCTRVRFMQRQSPLTLA